MRIPGWSLKQCRCPGPARLATQIPGRATGSSVPDGLRWCRDSSGLSLSGSQGLGGGEMLPNSKWTCARGLPGAQLCLYPLLPGTGQPWLPAQEPCVSGAAQGYRAHPVGLGAMAGNGLSRPKLLTLVTMRESQLHSEVTFPACSFLRT